MSKICRKINLCKQHKNMQKDKFVQAAMCVEHGEQSKAKNNKVDSCISPKHVRKNTAEYWKLKFEMAQEIINNTYEKSLKLNEIPGFLKIDRVKPKIFSTNHRVTQVHGSVEGKDVLSFFETIK